MNAQIETNQYGAVMLTGFGDRRRDNVSGPTRPGALSLNDARRLIGWLPLESETNTSTFITDNGVLTVDDPDQKKLLHPVTHEILGRHLSGYKVHGYSETLLRDAAAIASTELGIAKVTVLGGGRRAAVQYEFNENVTTSKGVEFRPFLSAATSLDGSIATSFFTGSTIVICDNTLHLALRRAVKDGAIYKVKHTRHSEVNVADARAALDIVFRMSDEFTEEIDRLTNQYVSDQKWKDILDELVPEAKDSASARTRGMAERKRAELNSLWNYDERAATWKNSAYGVVAAFNTWANQVQTVRNVDRGERNVAKMIDGTFQKLDTLVLRTLERV